MVTDLPEDLWRRLVEGSADAILYADAEGVIRLWNGAAERIFGFPASEAVGSTLDLIIPERLRGRHWDGWKKTMETGQTRYGAGELLAVPAVHREGRALSIEFSIQLLRSPGGAPAGMAAILRDVTARFERDKATRLRLKDLEARLPR